MGLLENKIAVITGGGRGIGKAIANQYSEQGATVIIAEFDENSGKNTADEIGGCFFKTDISDKHEVSSLFEYVKTSFSCLDILVNNAGVLDDSTLKNFEFSNKNYSDNTKKKYSLKKQYLSFLKSNYFFGTGDSSAHIANYLNKHEKIGKSSTII